MNLEEEITSVYTKFKPFAILGLITGDFPVQNTISATMSSNLSFKKCSFPYLWSLILLPVKLTALGVTTLVVVAMVKNRGIQHRQDLSTILTFSFTYMCTYFFGIIAHWLNQKRSGSLTRVLQLVDDFDYQYVPPSASKKSPLFSGGTWATLVACLMITLTPTMIVYGSYNFAKSHTGSGLWITIEEIDDLVWRRFIPAICGFVVVEFGVIFHSGTLFYISNVIIERLRNFLVIQDRNAESKGRYCCSDDQIKITRSPWERKQHGMCNHLHSSNTCGVPNKSMWNRACWKYLDFLTLFEEYENFIGLSFITLYITLTVSLICIIFLVLGGTDAGFFRDCLMVFTGMVVFNFYQVKFLADVGERVHGEYRSLVKAISKLCSDYHCSPVERSQLKQLLSIVTANPIALSAKGFFTIQRSNVTSILSVILTYLIVLSQLVLSSPTIVDKGNGQMNTTGEGNGNDTSGELEQA